MSVHFMCWDVSLLSFRRLLLEILAMASLSLAQSIIIKRSRYGTRSQGISVLPAHPAYIRDIAEWTIPSFCLSSRNWYSFTDPGGMKGWVGLGWLVGCILK